MKPKHHHPAAGIAAARIISAGNKPAPKGSSLCPGLYCGFIGNIEMATPVKMSTLRFN
jgi:hypothetical protein